MKALRSFNMLLLSLVALCIVTLAANDRVYPLESSKDVPVGVYEPVRYAVWMEEYSHYYVFYHDIKGKYHSYTTEDEDLEYDDSFIKLYPSSEE